MVINVIGVRTAAACLHSVAKMPARLIVSSGLSGGYYESRSPR